jgi:hypothetical protein
MLLNDDIRGAWHTAAYPARHFGTDHYSAAGVHMRQTLPPLFKGGPVRQPKMLLPATMVGFCLAEPGTRGLFSRASKPLYA